MKNENKLAKIMIEVEKAKYIQSIFLLLIHKIDLISLNDYYIKYIYIYIHVDPFWYHTFSICICF